MAKPKRKSTIKPKPRTQLVRADDATVEIIDKYVNLDGVPRRIVIREMAKAYEREREKK